MTAPCGWLVIDKPLGMTSRAAVNRVQTCLPRRTALGHCGTLDPLASGVLVVAVGVATRLAEYVQQLGKVYEAEFTLGATSATDDSEGPIAPSNTPREPAQAEVETALARFIGVIEQTPPVFSAVKVDGARAYSKARAGKPVDLTARPVRIDAIEMTRYEFPRVQLTIHCGKGTYIRSLARDLGASLGCGGYVSQLRRTAIGDFNAAEAADLDSTDFSDRMLPLARGVAALPRIDVPAELATRLVHGGFVNVTNALVPETDAAAYFENQLIAIVRTDSSGLLRPMKVLKSHEQ